jgi:hypothetical protein
MNPKELDDMSWWNILKRYDDTTYVVTDQVWNQAGGEGMDSIEDLEEKLNRKLALVDFSDSPANWEERILIGYKSKYPEHYELLMNRIGGEQGRKILARKYLEREKWGPNIKRGKTEEIIESAKKLLGE